MSQDIQRLIVSLEARTKAFENALNKANGVANNRAKAIEGRFAKMNTVIGSRMAGIGKGWIAGIVAGLGGRELAQLSDAATKIDNALKIAGLSGAELEKVYGKLRDSAVKNAAPLEALVTLYSRVAQAQDSLGVSQEQIVNFSDKVGVALRVSGSSAQEASGALLQLSQALGGGTVRAEEFNSINEGARPILQAVAAGLKEAGGSVATLRQLVMDGKISSEAFFHAFEAGAPILEQKVAGATYTIDQSMGNLRTALIDTAREFNNSTGAGERFAGGINNVAKAISDFDVSNFVEELKKAGSAVETFMNDAGNAGFFEWLAEKVTGKEITVGQPIDLDTVEAEKSIAALDRQIGILKDRIEANKEMAIDTTGAEQQLASLVQQALSARAAIQGFGGKGYASGTPGDPNALAQRSTLGPDVIKPVSTKDFKSPSSGSGSGSKKERRNEWERETSQIKERTAALQSETAAMAALNPLIDDYGFALEKARAVAELENAALAAKVKITPEVRASIESLATSYAQATVDAERLAESQDLIRERAQDMADLGKDIFGGFISDLRNGTSAAEALNNALSRIADTMINNVLDAIFQINGAGGSGIFGSLFAGLFGGGGGFSAAAFAGIGQGLYDKGGYTGPGGKKQPAGVVHKGEVVFSQDDVRRHGGVGAVEAMRLGMPGYANGGPVGAPRVPSMAAAGGGRESVHVTVGVSADNNGNLMPFVESVSRGQAQQVTANGLRAYDKGKQRQQMTGG